MPETDKPTGQADTELQERGDESFLQRWSARKTHARALENTRDKAAAEPPEPVEPTPAELTDADMPPLDSLDESSDYSGFFSPKVSQELRRVALRKLFHSPRHNITDGLDDYDEDYTSFAALGDTITSEMRYRLALDAEREREKAATAPSADAPADEAIAEPVIGEAQVLRQVPSTDETGDDDATAAAHRDQNEDQIS